MRHVEIGFCNSIVFKFAPSGFYSQGNFIEFGVIFGVADYSLDRISITVEGVEIVWSFYAC
jgi:hypothetical protein